MSIKSKKTYYPPRTFDDDLELFVTLYEQKGWAFSGKPFLILLDKY